jgi:uncharacterized protein (TIGR03437 family)
MARKDRGIRKGSLEAALISLSRATAALGLVVVTLHAQGIITTVAGSDYIFPDDGKPATQAQLAGPYSVAADSQGNYYIAEPYLNMVMKVDRNGVLTVLAGNGLKRFAGIGGPARAASIGEPRGVAVDAQGNVYIASEFVHAILKVDRNGVVTALASGFGFSGDGGPANQARLSHPTCVAVDTQGNVYFCNNSEGSNHRIRRIAPNGIITTVAGSAGIGSAGDGGPATGATLAFPQAVAVDAQGNLYISESGRIRRVSNGVITAFAGGGNDSINNGIPATQAALNGPNGLAFDPAGNLLVAEAGGNRVRRITPAGLISTIAGTGNNDFAGDGNIAANASFSNPTGVAADSGGNILIADLSNHRVRRLLASGLVETAAGQGAFIGDGGAAINARLVALVGLAVNGAGTLYIADTESRRLRQVSPGGLISTLIGTGRSTFSPDNTPAAAASIGGALAVAVDAANNVYFDDFGRIRRVTPAGVLTTFAGNGTGQYSGDGGPAINAGLTVVGMAFDRAGNLYFADNQAARVRRITPAGLITTIAGNGQRGYSGDNGPALNAAIDPTQGIVVDAAGNVYFSEYPNHRVRRVAPNGIITTFAGNGQAGNSGDGGPATAARVGVPNGLALDSAGNLYIATNNCNCVRRVSPSGIITRYAGGTRSGFGGDGGSALNAAFSFLNGLAVDSRDNVYIADFGNQRVRLVQAGVGPSIILSQKGLTFRSVSGAALPPPQTFTVVNGGQGPLNFGVFATTASGGNWLSAAPATGSAAAGAAGVPVSVTVNPAGLAPGDYYGQIEVRAAAAANTPQSITVVLSVLDAGGNAGVSASPSGLLFTATPGGANPADQTITLANFSPRNVAFGASPSFGDGRAWFALQPANGNVLAGQTTALRVVPNVAGFAAGIYPADITIAFSDNSIGRVQLLLVVAPAAGSTASRNRSADGCTPTRLALLATTIGNGFTATTSLPTPLEVRVVDDCGEPLTRGSVTASFSNGDAPLVLAGLRDGRWSATWLARKEPGAPVTVTFEARQDALTGSAQYGGSLQANANPPPEVAAGGVLHAASFQLQAPLALGNLVSIFGSALAQGDASAPALPLPTQLAGTTAVLAGRPLPLLFAGPTQINAMVPFDIPVDATHQLIVRRGTAISVPEPVGVLASQAGVFTKDQTGVGIGTVVAYYADGSYAEAGPANPLKAGDVIVIYCTGLGDVEPRAIAGVGAPFNELLRVINPVTVKIGGVDARVDFAGLTPGFTGLYQVNSVVPPGVEPGDEVPLLLVQSGRESPPVKLVVR